MFARAAASAPIGRIAFRYRPRRGVKARDVVQEVRVQRVSLGKGDKLGATCVIAREIAAPEGVHPLERRLLTNRTVSSLAEASELIEWYRARWEIERFFDILKNGCKVEELQLRTVGRLEVALALFMIVAWRIDRLMRLGRHSPEMEAAVIFEPEEIVAAYAANKREMPEGTPKLGEVMRQVAMAGGFLGRKGDGDPGVRTIWRGLERVMAFADGLRWARDHPATG